MQSISNKGKVYKANNMLQQKVGAGPLDPESVARMQDTIDNNDFDFSPLGTEFLDELEAAIKESGTCALDDINKHRAALTAPIMQLKGNAAIFHYSLIGNLSNVMLSFIESIKEVDKDALDVIRAHYSTLRAIMQKEIKGDGGELGKQMIKELRDACERYYAKKKRQS